MCRVSLSPAAEKARALNRHGGNHVGDGLVRGPASRSNIRTRGLERGKQFDISRHRLTATIWAPSTERVEFCPACGVFVPGSNGFSLYEACSTRTVAKASRTTCT